MMTNRRMHRTALAISAVLLGACNQDVTAPETGTSSASPVGEQLSALSGSWTTKANYPESAQAGAAVATVKNAQGQSMLYVIGGHAAGGAVSRVRAYNVATNTWIRRAEYPIPVYQTNGAAVINGKIYVSGGVTNFTTFHNELYMYDPAGNTWTRKRDMPDWTWGGISGVINNQLYVLTCLHQDECYSGGDGLQLYRYNPATDQWADLGTSPPQNVRPMGGTIGGKLYFTGGENDHSGPLMTVYDPATNQWTRKTPMNHVRNDAGFATYHAKLYIFGGWESPGDGTKSDVRTVNVYDPATDSWSNAAPLPAPRSGTSAALVVLNGQTRIELVGGPKPDNLQFTP
jgi:N-acetylneuraminic acid mutarotase